MAASTIFFNGRVISTPGSYSEVDASGLETVGLGATGIVAILGTAEGGKPWSAVDAGDARGNMQVATRPDQPFRWFRSGDLREAAPLAFGPSNDPDVPGGAAEVVFVKVNPAAKSSASFANVDGQALVLSSADYGYFTTQINVQIAAGTTKGKLITIVFEAVSEAYDDVGGDTVFTIQYLSGTPADGFATITAAVTASALVAAFTRTQIGLDNEVTNPATADEVIELVSSSASDVAVQVRIYGLSGAGAAQSEVVTLNGVTAVDTVGTWDEFHGAEVVSGTLVGTLTIRRNGAGLTITTIAPAGTEAAVEYCVDMPVAQSALTVVADAGSTAKVTLIGLSSAGAFQIETLTLNGTTPVVGTALWSRLDALALGTLAAARTLTVSGNALNVAFAGTNTVQKLADKVNGTPGFTLVPVTTRPSTYLNTYLDFKTAADIKSPAVVSVTGDLQAIIDKINASSQLVVATAGSVASGPPSNTTAPVFLAGGHEGASGTPGVITAQTQDWQGGLDLLKKVYVSTIVPLTSDPAIHALVKSHCEFMAGVGRSERDAVLGLQNAGRTDVPTKTELKSQIVDLNTRHCRVVAQAIERYNTAGDRTEFQPMFTAAVIAGMQAGAPVATPLTHKYANVLKLRQHATWNPKDDAEELIQAGILFLEVMDGVGRRVVRNVTTHLSSSNMAFTEGSVNQAVNYAVYNLRSELETAVGKRGFAGTVNATKGIAKNKLGLLVGVALVAWRSLDVQLILDVLEVGVEIAPVLPVNFVKNTIHLVTVPQTAA